MKRRRIVLEPRIRRLVHALNKTGLVTTFSSCEGHFGDIDRESYNLRDKADVRFKLNDGVSEAALESLFGRVIGNHVQSPLMWKAILSVLKEYVPGNENDYDVDTFFTFEIRPFNPYESDKAKRRNVDRVIAQTARSVDEYVSSRRKRGTRRQAN